MANDPGDDLAQFEAEHLHNRFLIEILDWNWELSVGVAFDAMPLEHRFQGGLHYTRGIDIKGRVAAPSLHRGKAIRIWISPFGPDINFDFTPNDVKNIGVFCSGKPARKTDFEAHVLLPLDALPGVLTCLSSVWKFLDIWIAEPPSAEVAVTRFAFAKQLLDGLDSLIARADLPR